MFLCGYSSVVCLNTTPMMNGFAKIILYSNYLHVKTVDAKTVNSRTTTFAHIIHLQGSQFSFCRQPHINEELYLNIIASIQGA